MPKPKTSEVRGVNGVEPQKWPVFGLKTQKRLKHMKNGRTSEVVRVTSGSEGASAIFWTPVAIPFFPIAHLFSKVRGFEANAK